MNMIPTSKNIQKYIAKYIWMYVVHTSIHVQERNKAYLKLKFQKLDIVNDVIQCRFSIALHVEVLKKKKIEKTDQIRLH